LNSFKFAIILKRLEVLGQIKCRTKENKTKSFLKQEIIITHMRYLEGFLIENFP
jgi:hypothetical protein